MFARVTQRGSGRLRILNHVGLFSVYDLNQVKMLVLHTNAGRSLRQEVIPDPLVSTCLFKQDQSKSQYL